MNALRSDPTIRPIDACRTPRFGACQLDGRAVFKNRSASEWITAVKALRTTLLACLLLRAGLACGENHPAGPSSATSSSRSAATSTASSIFSDPFSGTTLGSAWIAVNRHGDYGNGELQCYLPGNVSIGGGQLVVSSLAAPQSCGDSGHPSSTSAYTSGMVQWATFSFTYGTLEFRAKMAGGQGTWPAIWLLGANCQASNLQTADNSGSCAWPNSGSEEIDVTEILHSDHVHVNQALHSGGVNTNCTATTTDVTTNWHVYQLVWSPNSLVWTIDGVETCKLSSGVPSTPMFLIVNTALGGVGGSVVASTLPQTTAVDYVKVTQP